MKRFIAILLVIVCLFSLIGMLTACSSSSSSKTYTCGYCGRKMQGADWDYVNGRYACRTCSKAIRGNWLHTINQRSEISLRWYSLREAMYRNTKPINRCQCCQRGVALTDTKGAANFFGNYNSPQIIDPTNNTSCFHISFSFSAAKAPLPKGGWQKSLISDWGINAALRHIVLRTIIPPPLTRSPSL